MQVMNEDIAPTLREQMKHHEPIVCYAVENDPTVKIDTRGVGFSLRAREFKDPQIVCYSEKRFFEWHEDDKSVNIRASGASYGGENGDAFIARERHTSLSLGGGQAGQGYPCVLILNPNDSQGNQVADYRGIYPTLRGCGGAGYQQGYVLAPKG